MNFVSNKEKGNTGLALAIGYYGSNGYTISIPLNDTQDYDLIIDDGVLKKVQVKATGQRTPQGYTTVSVSSSGGTKGERYKTVKDTNVDILFVVTELMELYEVPKSAIMASCSMNLGPSMQEYRKDNIGTVYTTKVRTKMEKICECGETLGENNSTGVCLNCAMKERRVVDRPSKEILLEELKQTNFTAVGKKYGVSDNAIRKWCKSYGLPSTAREIKTFTLNNS